MFKRFIGIDYSGAATADTPLTGLRVYMAENGADANEVRPAEDARNHWSRRTLAHWLTEALRADTPTIVGIDHGFSFPLRYFQQNNINPDWHEFLDDFAARCPADEPRVSIDDVREGRKGTGLLLREARWRRIAEIRAGAKSVFHFDVPGSVAKSTHAGIPWLRYMRSHLGANVHMWPFDGWQPITGASVIAEVYPALWSKSFPTGSRTGDQHDAYTIAARLMQANADGTLAAMLYPSLTAQEERTARIEGWILGVP